MTFNFSDGESLFNSISQSPSDSFLFPSKMMFLFFINVISFLVKMAVQSSSHNFPIESKEELVIPGKTVAFVDCGETCGMSKFNS